MQLDFTPIVRHISGNQDIKIYPVSDLHIGASEFMKEKWEKFTRRLQGEPDSYVILAGDLMNNATRSSVSSVFEETMRPRDQKRWLVKELGKIQNRILCATPGNHERRSGKDADDDPLFDVMCQLGLADVYGENACVLTIRRGKVDGNGLRNPTYKFVIAHGAGGGAQTGSSVNRIERFAGQFENIDGVITGHTHKGSVTKVPKWRYDDKNKKFALVDVLALSCTSWLYHGGYALRALLPPVNTDLQTITLKGSEKKIITEW